MDHEANRERVKAALGVEASFDMKSWHTASVEGAVCGTIACIGGTAQILMRADGIETIFDDYDEDEYEDIGEWMGISAEAASELFFDYDACMLGATITVAQACQAIDNAAKFDAPRWEDVLGEP